MTYYRHLGIVSGVGVGGGSLVYANTLPVPKKSFFESESWSNLADWEEELKDFYPLALKMLGANLNPNMGTGDLALKEIAKDMNREEDFYSTNVAVYFGEPGKTVSDPYFSGKGPDRPQNEHSNISSLLSSQDWLPSSSTLMIPLPSASIP